MLNDSDITHHMEVADSTGRRVGTVDRVERDHIKLTRDGMAGPDHRYIAKGAVDHIADGMLILRANAPEPMTEAEIAAASAHHATVANPVSGAASRPIFGTSGTGTGMGGSGKGEN